MMCCARMSNWDFSRGEPHAEDNSHLAPGHRPRVGGVVAGDGGGTSHDPQAFDSDCESSHRSMKTLCWAHGLHRGAVSYCNPPRQHSELEVAVGQPSCSAQSVCSGSQGAPLQALSLQGQCCSPRFRQLCLQTGSGNGCSEVCCGCLLPYRLLMLSLFQLGHLCHSLACLAPSPLLQVAIASTPPGPLPLSIHSAASKHQLQPSQPTSSSIAGPFS
mmetsp:Transcript_74749/g.129596  ORF Transcript_74749/g.129596 Transcript_74749/m.129596 type:complete len:216 (+) Transcript_74749:389-1036(+)